MTRAGRTQNSLVYENLNNKKTNDVWNNYTWLLRCLQYPKIQSTCLLWNRRGNITEGTRTHNIKDNYPQKIPPLVPLYKKITPVVDGLLNNKACLYSFLPRATILLTRFSNKMNHFCVYSECKQFLFLPLSYWYKNNDLLHISAGCTTLSQVFSPVS